MNTYYGDTRTMILPSLNSFIASVKYLSGVSCNNIIINELPTLIAHLTKIHNTFNDCKKRFQKCLPCVGM